MSNRQKKNSVKLDPPVKVPHDGPLLYFLGARVESCDKVDNCMYGLQQAKALLQECIDSNGLNSEESVLACSIWLLGNMIKASTLKDQLSSVRAYRSKLVQIKSSSGKLPENENIALESIVSGMYRILFELSLSIESPFALKKALYSCLFALISLQPNSNIFEKIHTSILLSIFPVINLEEKSKKYWTKSVHTLFEILSFEPTRSLVLQHHNYFVSTLKVLLSEGDSLKSILEFTSRNGDITVIGADVLQAVENGAEICIAIKVLLTSLLVKQKKQLLPDEFNETELSSLSSCIFDQLLFPLLHCSATSIDALSVVGVTFGQLLLLDWRIKTIDDELIATDAGIFINRLIRNVDKSTIEMRVSEVTSPNINNLPDLNTLFIVRGIASAFTDNILTKKVQQCSNCILLINPIAMFMVNLARTSKDDAVRVGALKGLVTVLGRCKAILVSNSSESFIVEVKELSDDVLQLALVLFDSPPCRQVGSAIPGLFQSLVNLMQAIDVEMERNPNINYQKRREDSDVDSIEILVKTVLAQPSSRRGKYIALDCLLPQVGASKFIELSNSTERETSKFLISSFVNEIGERGNSASAVAELLGKILSMLREEMHDKAGIDLHRPEENKKDRRKREKMLREQKGKKNQFSSSDRESLRLLPSWMHSWAPSFVTSLLSSPKSSSRNHVASYCLPLIVPMVGGTTRKTDACHCFSALLDEIESKTETSECILWAKLQIIHHANMLKLLKPGINNSTLKNTIATGVSIDVLKVALNHQDPTIRLLAFQVLHIVLPTHRTELKNDPLRCVELEMQHWRCYLPFAFKGSDKEYMLVLNNALLDLLNRTSHAEAETLGNNKESTILTTFINEFLLENVFVKQAAYPGTISEKESFALEMITTLLSFASQRRVTKSQKNETAQKYISDTIVNTLVSENIFTSLISMLYSMWDNTRLKTYECIIKLVELAKERGVGLPCYFTSTDSYDLLVARAVHLASSPRQRESDSGARLLAILSETLLKPEDHDKFLKKLYDLSSQRIMLMEQALGVVVSPEQLSEFESNMTYNEIPLAHGLIQALKHIVEERNRRNAENSRDFCVKLTKMCCRAIEVSLVVVADVDDGMIDPSSSKNDGSKAEQRWKHARNRQFSSNAPLNVNTGALGANAIFSSLNPMSEIEEIKHLVMQRIVVGTWLLQKEACATLSSTLTITSTIDSDIVSTAGDLLISTITSLKHQGAAYAAHKSLQKICTVCYTKVDEDDLRLLPSKWSERLLHEISSTEVVRDSTLRRSAGYGLGNLSILRAEESNGPRFLFPHVLSSIIRLSLPSLSIMKKYLNRWHLLSNSEMFIFTDNICEELKNSYFIDDNGYLWKTRIHALNILRLIILDAPLASEMRKFIGDSIISALIGYSDKTWGVRNSATMTFAAAMLRVIDSDKNASGKKMHGHKSEKTCNAITAAELFRSYPSLASVLLGIMIEETGTEESTSFLHPALFPVLLLLSRLQPLSLSRIDPGANDVSIMLIDPVMKCLGHVHSKVRLVAARALSVLCTGDDTSNTSRGALVKRCIGVLSLNSSNNDDATSNYVNQNLDHGCLLAIKYLLISCPKPQLHHDDCLSHLIGYYATWGNFRGTCPPSVCVIAIEIWYIIHQAMDSNFEKSAAINGSYDCHIPLFDAIYIVIRSIEQVLKQGVEDIIGLSALAANAAKIAVEASYTTIFNSSNTEESLEAKLGVIQHLICSNSYDVMLHAVKSFKKKICDEVDKLVQNESATLKSRLNVLGKVSKMLFYSLFILMDREEASHPPTLRRISRCIVETVSGYKKLSNGGIISNVCNFSALELFQLVTKMFYLGCGDKASIVAEAHKPKANNILAGNAIELMGFVIADMCKLCHDDFTEHEFLKCISTFANFINSAMVPDISWKVRHSAALGVKESGLLSVCLNRYKTYKFEIETYKMRFHFQMLQLLQDGDEDVRKAAATALLPSTTHNPTSALRTLVLGYEEVSCGFANEQLFELFVQQILSQCESVEDDFLLVMTEIENTVQNTDLSNILNLGTTRKIFEEEELNNFEESLLIIHLSIEKLAKCSMDYLSAEVTRMFSTMISTCKKLLFQLKDILSRLDKVCDIAHNLTWNNKTFKGFHGVLTASILAIYFGVEGQDLIDEAFDILKMENTMLHPCIYEALNVLSVASQYDNATRKELLRCCFLVPPL